MKKILIGFLGAAALLGVFSLVMRTGLFKTSSKAAADAAPASAENTEAPAVNEGLPRYRTPEELASDYPNAITYISTTPALNVYISQYFACKAFQAGSAENVCGLLDKHLKEDAADSCTYLFNEGRLLKEAVSGGRKAMEYCLLEGGEEALEEDRAAGVDVEGWCREYLAISKSGDVKAYCRFMIADQKKDIANNEFDVPEPVMTMKDCQRMSGYLTGDPRQCDDSVDGGYCREQAFLVQALREGDAADAEQTFYAPLVKRSASCEGPRKKVMDFYNRLVGLQDGVMRAQIRLQRYSSSEQERHAREQAAAALEMREKIQKMQREGEEREAKRRQEIEEAKAAAERKRIEEERENYQASKIADEERRRRKGLKLRPPNYERLQRKKTKK